MALPVLEAFTGPTFESDAADNTLTLTTPVGTVEGDLLVAQFAFDRASTSEIPADDDAASGWTKEIQLVNDNDPDRILAAIYWLFAPAVPDATYSFTKSSNAGTVMGGGMLRISGAHVTVPIDVTGSASGISTDVDCPDIPTNVIDTLVLRFFAADDNDYGTSGFPAGHTGLYADDTSLGSDMTIGAAWIDQAGIGDTGVGRFTGLTAVEEWVAFTVAIAPSLGPAAAVTIDVLNGEPLSGGVSATVEGVNYEAVQGTGFVKISPADDVDDVGAVTQTITNWTETEVTFTVVRGALSLDTNVFLFVENDNGDSNASGFVLQIVPEFTLDFAEPVGVIFNITFSQIPAPPINPVADFTNHHPWFYPRW